MATITKRKIALIIEWDKDTPNDLTWHVRTQAVVADTTADAGEKVLSARSANQTSTRTAFRGFTGAQIETNTKSVADSSLQLLGSGAGGHTLTDDTGN